MTPLAEQFKKWVMQKPPEPSVMAPVGSRARLASDTQADRESRADILRVIGMLPIPGADLAQVAGDLSAESEITPYGVAKAVAGAIMPARTGKGKINVMGEASKVDPDVLLRIKKSLAHGVPTKRAYQQENALPLTSGEQPEDAWIPIMPNNAGINAPIEKAFRDLHLEHMEYGTDPGTHIKTTFGSLYEPAALKKIEKHYPELLDREVRIEPIYGGVQAYYTPKDKYIQVATPKLYGQSGLASVAAHEGTHALQDIAMLPQGYNSKAVAKDLGELRKKLQQAGEMPGDFKTARLADAILNKKLILGPGEAPLPPEFSGVTEQAKHLARAISWMHRNNQEFQMPHKLYKAYHGEQVAEAARKWNLDKTYTPDFTTPLSKQVFNQGTLQYPSYHARLQRLFELEKAGTFNALQRPFDFPEPINY